MGWLHADTSATQASEATELGPQPLIYNHPDHVIDQIRDSCHCIQKEEAKLGGMGGIRTGSPPTLAHTPDLSQHLGFHLACHWRFGQGPTGMQGHRNRISWKEFKRVGRLRTLPTATPSTAEWLPALKYSGLRHVSLILHPLATRLDLCGSRQDLTELCSLPSGTTSPQTRWLHSS